MTPESLWAILRRQSLIVVLGIVGSGLLATLTFQHPGVYATRLSLVLIAPEGRQNDSPSISSTSNDVIALAGLVERTFNANRSVEPETTGDVDLVGFGVRDGVQVRLPNQGGQWDYNFDSPTLSIQVVAPSPSAVRSRREAVVARIRSILVRLQASNPRADRVWAREIPENSPVALAKGHPLRAAIAVATAGAAVTIGIATWTDRIRQRRRPAIRHYQIAE